MKLIIEENEEKMSESCMQIVLGAMMQDKRVNISLTSGRSPRTMYRMMIPYVRNQAKYSDIQYYLFDDSMKVGEKHGGNWKEMHEIFFDEAEIPDERIHCIDAENWMNYDREIADAGGIDVMVIGLGWDGHFCSNMPKCTPMGSLSYRMERRKLAEANHDYAGFKEDYPYYYTMGPASLMRVRHLVMIVNGKEKAEILKRMLTEPVSGNLPATVLRLHPNFTLIADRDAASCLTPEIIAAL